MVAFSQSLPSATPVAEMLRCDSTVSLSSSILSVDVLAVLGVCISCAVLVGDGCVAETKACLFLNHFLRLVQCSVNHKLLLFIFDLQDVFDEESRVQNRVIEIEGYLGRLGWYHAISIHILEISLRSPRFLSNHRQQDSFAHLRMHLIERNRRRSCLRAMESSGSKKLEINAFLGITSKRPDGYHDLASVFHFLKKLFTQVIKALDLYRKKIGSNTYFWVHLDKRVPSGASLGGGSGNATIALWATN
ncbi:hypothetical protein SELMODRAFT_420282 [Selaginella moellendorffii]|uniref:GHMP kinase N-terminal domain-containing protein n=1 Tax=Selaginella moellendorffii TaxID=88036 RepID=D8SBH9_SELML|nr:hypothetical protein SELMODRAFT_420282 [Selaginella moellendorffii]